ncbi:radical SAM protein [Vulcanisaeta distributa]|uniref:radical SAM protein n=1 Tax=Vulcanisaeta distributa TaxID=164451 RepID=UPI0006D09FD7|nr:radical SAM protein [Vulcanisaeta distributa]
MNSKSAIPPLEIMLIYITRRCNLTCPHCFVPTISIKNKEEDKDEVSFNELTKAIIEASSLGLKYVKITGGEPFVRKDLVLKVTKFCAEQNIFVSYDTNATLLDEQDIKTIAKLGNVKRVAVSLDYSSPIKFDTFRGLNGAYNKVINNIKLFKTYGIDVLIMASIYEDNL